MPKLQWNYITFVIVALLILSGCEQPRAAPPPFSALSKQIIELEVVDQVVHYRCQSFWSYGKFSELSDDDLRARFEERYDVEAEDFEFSFDGRNHSTITECYIYGIISKSQDRYRADFLWFLNPLGLDFIEDGFEKSNHGLSWKGDVKGVPTTNEVECPLQDSIYEAWQHPVGHCHGHVWWPVSS